MYYRLTFFVLQALRTRGTLFVVTSPYLSSLRIPHNISRLTPRRSESTFQDSTGQRSNELVSSILHGALTNDGNNMRHRSSQQSTSAENGSNQNIPGRATSSQRAQEVTEAKVPKSVAGQKRKARDPLPLPPIRRRRREAPPVKGRRSYGATHTSGGLPTASQYPHLPSLLFQNPKEHLHDVIHAEYVLRSEFLRQDKTGNHHRLTCTPKDGTEPISTLGRANTRVRFSTR